MLLHDQLRTHDECHRQEVPTRDVHTSGTPCTTVPENLLETIDYCLAQLRINADISPVIAISQFDQLTTARGKLNPGLGEVEGNG